MARKSKLDQAREEIAKDSKVKPLKAKRKRKPMTEEQKKAAAERLAKAREKKMEEQGAPKSVHPDVLALPEDDKLSLKNVRNWIKTQKELLSAARAELRANVKGAESRVAMHEGYIRNLDRYIRDGIYCDLFYGEHQESRIKQACVAPAYDKDGNIKRSYGVFYADLGGTFIGNGKIEVNGEVVNLEDA